MLSFYLCLLARAQILKVKAIPSHTSNTLLCKLSAMMKLLEKFNILAVGVTSHKLRHLEMGVS